MVAVILFAVGVFVVAANMTRPLLLSPFNVWSAPRSTLYFASHPPSQRPFEAIAAVTLQSGCRDIGLLTGSDALEYPIWRLLTTAAGPPRIEHFVTRNDVDVSQGFLRREHVPTVCAVVSVHSDLEDVLGANGFVTAARAGSISLWLKRQ